MEQRGCCPDLFYTVVLATFWQPVSHQLLFFSICSFIGPSATVMVQVRTYMAFRKCLLPTQCDLLGEERQSLLPIGSQLGDAVGRRCWQPQGWTALSFSALRACWPPCWTAVIAPWPAMDTERETTRMEACFLFACRHVACPPQLREEHQMPGRSVSPLDYSPWL